MTTPKSPDVEVCACGHKGHYHTGVGECAEIGCPCPDFKPVEFQSFDHIYAFPGLLTVRVNADRTCEYTQGRGSQKPIRISRPDAAKMIRAMRKGLASL